jgi:hypothetical protein
VREEDTEVREGDASVGEDASVREEDAVVGEGARRGR